MAGSQNRADRRWRPKEPVVGKNTKALQNTPRSQAEETIEEDQRIALKET
jgi:hypothetical protein